MNEIDCMYYDKNENSCALRSSYFPTGRIVAECEGNACQDKTPRPLLSPPPQNAHNGMSCTGKNCPLGFGEVKKCTVHNCEDRTKPKTNFDRLTASVESLAEYIYQVTSCCPFKLIGVAAPCTIPLSNKSCTNCIKEWLQKEADDGIQEINNR